MGSPTAVAPCVVKPCMSGALLAGWFSVISRTEPLPKSPIYAVGCETRRSVSHHGDDSTRVIAASSVETRAVEVTTCTVKRAVWIRGIWLEERVERGTTILAFVPSVADGIAVDRCDGTTGGTCRIHARFRDGRIGIGNGSTHRSTLPHAGEVFFIPRAGTASGLRCENLGGK